MTEYTIKEDISVRISRLLQEKATREGISASQLIYRTSSSPNTRLFRILDEQERAFERIRRDRYAG